jgi:phosphoglycolate phosphatase
LSPPLQLVIFDVDGTLVDSQALIVAAQREAFAACGLVAPTRERSLSIVGLSLREAFTALVGPLGPVEELAEAYRQAFGRLRADPACEEPLFPGIEGMIRRLAAEPDILLGIATGKSRKGVAHLVDRHGWDRVFTTIQTADDSPSKPDPGMLLAALAETGLGPADAVMIGDTTFDMLMARAAGIRPIGVSWGYHPVPALWEAGAETVIDDVEHLAPLIGLRQPAGAAAHG